MAVPRRGGETEAQALLLEIERLIQVGCVASCSEDVTAGELTLRLEREEMKDIVVGWNFTAKRLENSSEALRDYFLKPYMGILSAFSVALEELLLLAQENQLLELGDGQSVDSSMKIGRTSPSAVFSREGFLSGILSPEHDIQRTMLLGAPRPELEAKLYALYFQNHGVSAREEHERSANNTQQPPQIPPHSETNLNDIATPSAVREAPRGTNDYHSQDSIHAITATSSQIEKKILPVRAVAATATISQASHTQRQDSNRLDMTNSQGSFASVRSTKHRKRKLI